VREDDSWRVAPLAPGLVDRRVEITGPVERKMMINALNCARRSSWPTSRRELADLGNCIDGQVNVKDAVRREISLDQGEKSRTG